MAHESERADGESVAHGDVFAALCRLFLTADLAFWCSPLAERVARLERTISEPPPSPPAGKRRA